MSASGALGRGLQAGLIVRRRLARLGLALLSEGFQTKRRYVGRFVSTPGAEGSHTKPAYISGFVWDHHIFERPMHPTPTQIAVCDR
jgi:hypothetical protein